MTAPRGSLTIVGTGFRVTAQITPEAAAHLRDADRVFHAVGDPITRMWIEALHPDAQSLLDTYAVDKSRAVSYREMVDRILAPLQEDQTVCAAFYGHPGVFVHASHRAIREARDLGFEARMLPGISAEDCLFADLGVDPSTTGCQSFEATDFLLRQRRFDPRSSLILWQIGAIGVTVYREEKLWSRQGLKVLAEVLEEHYPAEHQSIVYEASAAPICDPVIRPVALSELPRSEITVASTLYVPPREPAAVDPTMAARLGLGQPP
jgi:uncharacterized protein YabN with tetrapyrrole methylase and pyrophosphatase domain